jgi:hypothetical protein
VVLRSAVRRDAAARIVALRSYIFVMSYIRIKTIKFLAKISLAKSQACSPSMVPVLINHSRSFASSR